MVSGYFFVLLCVMKKLAVILVLCLCSAAQAQTYLEGAFSSGVFFPQQDIAAEKEFPYPYAWSLGMSQQIGDGPGWVMYCPRVGAQLMRISPGKPEDAGMRINALQLYLRFSFLKQKYLLNPGLRLAVGVGYAEMFPEKNAVPLLSSRWHAVASADLDLETRLSPRFVLRTGVGVLHISGLEKTPECVNMLTATVGLAYVFGGTGDECFPNNFKKKERSFVNPGKGSKRLKKNKGGQECW